MSKDYYSKIDRQIEQLTSSKNYIDFYDEEIVNRTGPRGTTEQPYTDYIAKRLLELNTGQEILEPLKGISKRNDYFERSHHKVDIKFNNSSVEKIFAKSLYGHKVTKLGRILDYEVPLSEREENIDNAKSYGEIDLISYNRKNKVLYLIELKRASKDHKYETLLRAGLEIATYGHLTNYSKLRNYFKKVLAHRYKKHNLIKHQNNKFAVRYAVLYATNEIAGIPRELRPENRDRYYNLFELLKKLNIGVFTIDHHYPTNMHNDPWK